MISERLAALKQQREFESRTFPLWALFIIFEKCDNRSLHENGCWLQKRLIEWLGPIEIPPHPAKYPRDYVPAFNSPITLQALLLNCTPLQAHHGYTTATTILFQSANTPRMSAQIPTQ